MRHFIALMPLSFGALTLVACNTALGTESDDPVCTEQLLDAFELDDVQPITVTIEVTEADLGGPIESEILTIVDPAPGL